MSVEGREVGGARRSARVAARVLRVEVMEVFFWVILSRS